MEMDLQLAFISLVALSLVGLLARYVWKTYIRPASKTGFGRGAPGFQTAVRKEWVKKEDLPADHILRRRVVEEVDLRPNATKSTFAASQHDASPASKSGSATPTAANEWLPASSPSSSKRPSNNRKSSSQRKR